MGGDPALSWDLSKHVLFMWLGLLNVNTDLEKLGGLCIFGETVELYGRALYFILANSKLALLHGE